VTGPDETTPLALAGMGVEVALVLCGLVLLWRLALSPRARRERVTRLPEWRLNPVDFACFLFFAILGALVPSALAALVLRHVSLDSASATIVGASLQEGGLLLGVYAFYALIGRRIGSSFGPLDVAGSLRSGLATFLIALPFVEAASLGWGFALEKLGVSTEKQQLLEIFEDLHSNALRAVFVALAVLLVPPAEEILFRGGLFRYLRTRLPRWVAILATSVLFAALHNAWVTLLPLVVLACFFCLAYERTGLIGTTIIAHALFNLNSVLMVVTGAGS
jgi:membrane protease YdiL (CAAX protease family)